MEDNNMNVINMDDNNVDDNNMDDSVMEQRARFYSCSEDLGILESEGLVDKSKKHENKDQSKNEKQKDKTNAMIRKGPSYKTTGKPKTQSLRTQLLKKVAMNTNKKGSMIKARHNYVENSNKTIANSSNDDNDEETDNDQIEDDASDKSPKAKKQRTREIEGLYWSIEAVAALKELESLAENSEIIDLIKCFDTDSVETNCFNKTKENIRECTRTWSEKEIKMRNAIKFIENDGKTDHLDSIKFEELITCLIITINNRMPKKCNECNELYKVNIHTQPILRCMICNIGMHDCKSIDKNEMVSGILWMCHCCSSIGTENKVFDNVKMQIISKIISGKNTVRKRVNKRKRIQDNFNDIVVVEAEIHVRDQNASENRQDRRNIGKSKANEGKVIHEKKEAEQNKNKYEERQPRENNNEEPKRKMDRVCTYWARGICKFDSNCHYAHPVICPVIMEKGTCQGGDNCKQLFHPKMCRDMNQTGQCQRGQRCYFTHFKEAQSRPMYNRRSNQRDHNPLQQNGNPNNYQNYNQQWNNNSGNNNGNDAYNQMQGHHMDFYMNQNQNWKAMNKPIMERAAEILAEKMWGNQ